jgi:hypothetical protein
MRSVESGESTSSFSFFAFAEIEAKSKGVMEQLNALVEANRNRVAGWLREYREPEHITNKKNQSKSVTVSSGIKPGRPAR